MKRSLLCVFTLCVSIGLTGLAQAQDLKVLWKDGLRMESADKSVQFRLSGRVLMDGMFTDTDQKDYAKYYPKGGSFEDDVEFRMARLQISGTIEQVEFKAEYEFAGNNAPDFKDVYVGLTDLPYYIGNIRIGHQKEPFSLDILTSDLFITFMERALPTTFAPNYNWGIQFRNSILEKKLGWGFGVFKGNSNDDDKGLSPTKGGVSFTGRVFGTPWYEEDGKQLIHIGAGYSYHDARDDANNNAPGYSKSFTPESHLAQKLLSTGSILAERVNMANVEAAGVYGAASIQGEYIWNEVEPIHGKSLSLDGYYAQASYFITGEHRAYKLGEGTFDRVVPYSNFMGKDKGIGAWEVAARFSSVDLSDITGKTSMDDITAGVNWYLNPNTKFVVNYTHFAVDKGLEDNLYQFRFQFDF